MASGTLGPMTPSSRRTRGPKAVRAATTRARTARRRRNWTRSGLMAFSTLRSAARKGQDGPRAILRRFDGELHGRQRPRHGGADRGWVHPHLDCDLEGLQSRGPREPQGRAGEAPAGGPRRGPRPGRRPRQPGAQPPDHPAQLGGAADPPQDVGEALNLAPSAVAVLVAYVVGITAFGSWLGRRRRSVKDYFLAGRTVPWWAIAACIVATETSTLTFTGAPGMAYTGNWTFLQLVLGYVLGRFLISLLFIPAYFRGDIYTSYEVLQRRFGGPVRATAAGIFLLYRTLGDGIRLHAAALVIAVAAGLPEWVCILVLGLAMILYTEEGGVTATIWTDVVQM